MMDESKYAKDLGPSMKLAPDTVAYCSKHIGGFDFWDMELVKWMGSAYRKSDPVSH